MIKIELLFIVTISAVTDVYLLCSRVHMAGMREAGGVGWNFTLSHIPMILLKLLKPGNKLRHLLTWKV